MQFSKKFSDKWERFWCHGISFFGNSLWEKHKRDEGVLLPWQLGEAQAGRGYSGTDKAWHPDSRWEKWGPGDWVGMNNLLFSYSSATLPDLKTEPIELNSTHSDCDWWTSIHASPLTWKAHPLLVSCLSMLHWIVPNLSSGRPSHHWSVLSQAQHGNASSQFSPASKVFYTHKQPPSGGRKKINVISLCLQGLNSKTAHNHFCLPFPCKIKVARQSLNV